MSNLGYTQRSAKMHSGRHVFLIAWLLALLAFFLYIFTLAPGLTWAHFGADGGELIAAAMVNGVPHPPGYPLYILILRGWLTLGRALMPTADLSWLGNLFSALCAAASVGITTRVGAQVLALTIASDNSSSGDPAEENSGRPVPSVWLWAAVIGMAWATAPLLWKQAIITEVYALHALLLSLLGWALLVRRGNLLLVTIPIALGVAHHLTFVLLLPGVLYWLWHIEYKTAQQNELRPSWFVSLFRSGIKLVPAILIGVLFYIRIPLAASGAPPINWGYPDNWDGFWWLTSAAAYRDYLFGVPASSIFDRIAEWAYNLTSQYSAIGLALALLGLSNWDRKLPALRNFGLLWLLPISIYAISYYTKDSTIYLLPCMWLLALWLGAGLVTGKEWLDGLGQRASMANEDRPKRLTQKAGEGWRRRLHQLTQQLPSYTLPVVTLIGLLLLTAFRLPEVSLRYDNEARDFVDAVEAVLPPDSIIVSSADAETFSLWYGVWGSQQLADDGGNAPYLINGSLLQFPWYQRLVREYYAELPGAGDSIRGLLQQNLELRPIFFSEENQPFVSKDSLEPVGPLWQYSGDK